MTIRIALLWGLCSLAVMLTVMACSPANDPDIPVASDPDYSADQPSTTSDSDTEPNLTNEPLYQDSDCQLIMGFDIWEPYQFIDIGHQVNGLDVEIAEAAAGQLGCDIEFVQATWVELLQDLQSGEVDFVMGASMTPEREAFAYFSQAYRDEQFVLFTRYEDQRQFRDLSLLEVLEDGMRVGIVEGYYYGDDFQAYYQQIDNDDQFVDAMMSEFNLARLLDHDIDGFLEDHVVGHSLLRRKGLDDYIVHAAVELPANSVYIMFSRESTDSGLVESFNQVLDELKNNGEYDAILQRYLP